MQQYKDGMRRTAEAAPDASITVTGLTVDRYLELKQAEKDLHSLMKRIAACAKINTAEIDRKEEKYRKRRQEIKSLARYAEPPTEQEREELEKLENEWLDAQESPRVTVDGNKVAELILEYAACGMSEKDREHYGFCDGLPDGAKVKIE